MLWRVRDILPVIAQQIGGAGVDMSCNPEATQRVLDAYNRINEIFMNRHDWPGSEADVCFSAEAGCITLPAQFDAIKAIAIDNEPTRILPAGWEYLENGPGWVDESTGVSALQHIGSHFPLFRDLPKPMRIGAFSTHEETQANLTINGLDTFGRNIGHPTLSIPIVMGANANQPRMTDKVVASISAVSKPVTKGYVEIFGWDECDGMTWLSRMEPGDTSPSFTRYRLTGIGCSGVMQIRARVSFAYRILHSLDEVSIVQHREAYRLAAQAITAFDDGNGGIGSEYMNRAMKMLRDKVAKTENGQRKGLHLNMHHRRGLARPWRYTNR
jgi:hypothetical protein